MIELSHYLVLTVESSGAIAEVEKFHAHFYGPKAIVLPRVEGIVAERAVALGIEVLMALPPVKQLMSGPGARVYWQHVPSPELVDRYERDFAVSSNDHFIYRPGFTNGNDIRTTAIEGYRPRRWTHRLRLEKYTSGGVSLGPELDSQYLVDHAQTYWPFPIQVSVLILNTCNLKCVMCPLFGEDADKNYTGYYDKAKRMKRELFERIALEVGAHKGMIKVGNIEEPLLHTDLPHFVRFARQNGVSSFHITTNGTLMTRELAIELIEGGLTSIFFSVDSISRDGYRAIRGGDFDDLVRRVDMFMEEKEKRNPAIQTGAAYIHQDPVKHEKDDFIDFWLKKVDKAVIYQRSRVIGIEDQFDHINFPLPDTRSPCPLPWTEMYVLPEGEVITCCRADLMVGRVGIFEMGNAAEQSLAKIWTGPVFKRYREQLLHNNPDDLPEVCQGCSIFCANKYQSWSDDKFEYSQNPFLRTVCKKT